MRNETGNDAEGDERYETARKPKQAPPTSPRHEARDDNGGERDASAYTGKADGRKPGPAGCTETVENKNRSKDKHERTRDAAREAQRQEGHLGRGQSPGAGRDGSGLVTPNVQPLVQCFLTSFSSTLRCRDRKSNALSADWSVTLPSYR